MKKSAKLEEHLYYNLQVLHKAETGLWNILHIKKSEVTEPQIRERLLNHLNSCGYRKKLLEKSGTFLGIDFRPELCYGEHIPDSAHTIKATEKDPSQNELPLYYTAYKYAEALKRDDVANLLQSCLREELQQMTGLKKPEISQNFTKKLESLNRQKKFEVRAIRALSAQLVVGTIVKNPQGRVIGQVEDLMVDLKKGSLSFLTVRFKKYFDPLQRKIPVPKEVLILKGDDECEIMLDVTKDQIRNISGYEDGRLPRSISPESMMELYRHYGFKPYWN